MCLHRST
jgi:serine/threonine protein kinase